MGSTYASVNDLIQFGKTLTAQEYEQADSLLNTASAKLRIIAKKYGKNIDAMIAEDEDYSLVAKDIVVNAVKRALESYSDDMPAATQTSQTAMGYSVSMTYLNAGQSLYFLRNELKDLGILRQRYGAVEVYSDETAD